MTLMWCYFTHSSSLENSFGKEVLVPEKLTDMKIDKSLKAYRAFYFNIKHHVLLENTNKID